MECQLCAMCKQNWVPLSGMTPEIQKILEELAVLFGFPRDHFDGDTLCSGCTELCVLTHHVYIRKRKQAEDQQQRASKQQGNPSSSGRRPSVGQSDHRLSLAKRMRLALEAARNRELRFARSNETKENFCANNGKDEITNE